MGLGDSHKYTSGHTGPEPRSPCPSPVSWHHIWWSSDPPKEAVTWLSVHLKAEDWFSFILT